MTREELLAQAEAEERAARFKKLVDEWRNADSGDSQPSQEQLQAHCALLEASPPDTKKQTEELRAQADAMPRIVREGRDFDVKFHDNGAATSRKDGTRSDGKSALESAAAAAPLSAAQPAIEQVLPSIEGDHLARVCVDGKWFTVPRALCAPPDLAAQLVEMEARKDAAYLERNQVVAALAKCFPSGIKRTAIEGWSEDWHGCVYIDLPTGQASWHYHDSHAHLFSGLPSYTGAWDGHSTEAKYSRLSALLPQPDLAARVRELEAALRNLLNDTQHSEHHCGDEACPVSIARAVLAKETQ